MDDVTFDNLAREELAYIEEQLLDVDPDDIDLSFSEGVMTLELKDGVRVVINSHRAARQIWMAAIADAWHFSYDDKDARWRTTAEPRVELRATLKKLVSDRIGVAVAL